LEIEFSFSGSGTLPPEVQIAFYRIAQEIFNNIVKHSGASNVTVTLKSTSDHVLLDIIDDGVGFDVENTPPGIGMMTMHERADAINAAFTIESSPGRGTHIRVMWPRDDTRR
jgi:signal transduction histidine kinase